MPTSIALSPYFEKFVHEQIDSGRYGNVSEVIRAGLRLLEEHERAMKIEELRVATAQGIESGEGVPAEEAFTRLRAKYQRMVDNGSD
ncbi:type II toxin-antitoxin system ParD family antitoxin [Serratia quinivorans]|uniref:type II toxin-antitoxin system ParD family antitoxin n=1 Tax=Serratia quinivorans TaxID=137545 RepID=UPI003F9681A9